MFNFLNNSFKAVTYGKTILQTNYDVMIVLAQKKTLWNHLPDLGLKTDFLVDLY